MSNESRQAVFDAAREFVRDASDENFAALQQAVGAHKPDGADAAAPPEQQQAAPEAAPEAPPS